MIYFPYETVRFTASTSSMIGEMVGEVDVQCDSGESLSTLTILDNTVPFNISASNLRITVADTLVFNKYTFKIKAVSNLGNEATANVVVNVRGGIDPPPPPSIEPSNIGLVFNKFATWAGKALQFAKAAPTPPTFDSVTIGTQTWMSKNLAIDDGQGGITIVDNVTANGVNFGTQYYYTWDAAVRVANSVEGWHLPTAADWDTLATTVGGSSDAGTKLKSTTGWNDNGNGTDDYGFTALPVSYNGEHPGGSSLLGDRAYFWTSTEYSSTHAYYCGFLNDSPIMDSWRYSKTYGFSVRLIKDT